MIYINGESVAPAITQGIDDITTPDYVTDGLIALYDGLKNTANGHITRINSWKDLSGNGRDMSASSNRLFLMDAYYEFENGGGFYLAEATAMPEVKTIELVFRGSRSSMIIQVNRSTKGCYIVGNGAALNFTNGGYQYPLADSSVRNAVSFDYDTGICFINGTEVAHTSSTSGWSKGTSRDIVTNDYDSFSYDYYGDICSIRLYSKTLTDEERQHNYAIDVERFGVA